MNKKFLFFAVFLWGAICSAWGCNPGEWLNGGTCVKCPAGYTSTGQITSQDDCYMEIVPGYYWTGSMVEICPQTSACAGGNMPYGNRDGEWGIVECEGRYFVYYGATSCTYCPVEPLNGRTGNMTEGGCYLRMYSDSGIDIGANEYTTSNANCYWNGTHYGRGGNNTYGCDQYRITACAPGYYAPVQSRFGRINCNPVGVGYYSADTELDRTECPAGTTTRGENAASVAECLPLCNGGMTRMGAGKYGFYIWKDKLTSPAIHIRAPNGDICYVSLAPGHVDGGINIRYNNTVYHVIN